MDPVSEERLSRRGRRALPLIVLALVVIAGTSLAYMHPTLPSQPKAPAATMTPTPPLLPERYLVAYDFVTRSAGWALVEDPVSATPSFWVFKTTDAARHWQRQLAGTISSTNAGSLKVKFFDRDNGLIAVGGTRAVYRTQDGGVHWTAVATPEFASSTLFFTDPLHGWVLGTVQTPDPRILDTRFFSTADAGDHWDVLPQPPAWSFAGKGGFGELAFRTPQEGWIGGATAGHATVYSTIDGGISWQAHQLPVLAGKGGPVEGLGPLLESTVFLLPGAGVLAATFDLNGSPIGLTSFDGGSTWRRLSPPPGETTYGDFIFQDTFHWWAMRYGTLFKSSDAGQTWKEVAQQLDEWDYVPQIVDAKHAWAPMTVVFPSSNPPKGTGLAVTEDGGIHWTPVSVPKPS
ncbi:MAG: WD40/YVTN/BNR-like repeat-containing protein [Candidatus Dormibacteraceae bacterium]